MIHGKTFLMAVSGRKEHGKTTLASKLKVLIESKGIDVSLIGFSDPMYRMARMLTLDDDFSKSKRYVVKHTTDQLIKEFFGDYHHFDEDGNHTFLNEKYKASMFINEKLVAAVRDHIVFPSMREPMTGTEILQKLGTECSRDIFGVEVWNDCLIRAVMQAEYPTVVIASDCRVPVEREMVDFGIYVVADGVETQQNVRHRSEDHHDYLREHADVVVQRHGDHYDVSIIEIVERIMHARWC